MMLIRKSDVVRLSLLAIMAFYCVLPLFLHDGLPSSHDIFIHIFQAEQFTRAVAEGVWYPRWLPDYNNGYGSATFIFYAPLAYYVVTAIKLFTSSLTTAMIVTIWLAFFLSGVTMFAATKRIFGGTDSVLPAIIYQIIPFHLMDIYLRGTFAEILAFAWFPLIILFAYETIKSESRTAMLGLSVSYAGLILTHLVSAFILSLVAGAYIVYTHLFSGTRKAAVKALFSMVLGLGLSAVYLVPVIFERKFVQINYIVTCDVGDYRRNFLFTWDKFEPILRIYYVPLHIMVGLEVILFLCIAGLMSQNKQKLPNIPQQNFFMFLFAFAFFLTTPLSRPLWSVLPGFPFLQFPWRWVLVMEISLCFLIGALLSLRDISVLGPPFLRRAVIYCLVTVFLVSLATIVKTEVIHEKFIGGTLQPEKAKIFIRWPIEYTPIWVKDIKKIMTTAQTQKVGVISGDGVAELEEWKSEHRGVMVKAATPVLVRIATFYYPGWKAEIDGVPAPITIEKKSGAMLIDVPQGEHRLTLRFGDIPLRRYAKMISVFALCMVVLLPFFMKRPRVKGWRLDE